MKQIQGKQGLVQDIGRFEKSGFHCILNNENFKMDIEQMNFATHFNNYITINIM